MYRIEVRYNEALVDVKFASNRNDALDLARMLSTKNQECVTQVYDKNGKTIQVLKSFKVSQTTFTMADSSADTDAS